MNNPMPNMNPFMAAMQMAQNGKNPIQMLQQIMGSNPQFNQVEYKRIKNVSLIWTEEFDIIKEWDDNGHIIKQEIANYQRYRTIS